MNRRVYVSGPLQASRDLPLARALYETFARACRQAGYDPYLPHVDNDPERDADNSPEDVYARDISELRRSAAVVAHVGAPSSGVGAELAVAVAEGIPVIAISRPGEPVSRFLAGMLRAHPRNVEVVCDDDDVMTLIPPALAAALAAPGAPDLV